MFALQKRGPSGRDPSAAAERREAVQGKALELAGSGQGEITADDVVEALGQDGLNLNVSRPATMVGAALRAMKEFERVGRNIFRYRRG